MEENKSLLWSLYWISLIEIVVIVALSAEFLSRNVAVLIAAAFTGIWLQIFYKVRIED